MRECIAEGLHILLHLLTIMQLICQSEFTRGSDLAHCEAAHSNVHIVIER